MPEQPTQRTPRPSSPRRKNGNHAATFWSVSMVVGGDLDLLVEFGEGSQEIGLSVCAMCAALIPGSETSQQLHRNWHEAIRGLDSRTP
jgi:hypothetical protein